MREAYEYNGFVISPQMVAALERYVEAGVLLGDFLYAVVINNFKEACGRADSMNAHNFCAFGIYTFNVMPIGSQGSEAKYQAWIAHRGLRGLREGANEASE